MSSSVEPRRPAAFDVNDPGVFLAPAADPVSPRRLAAGVIVPPPPEAGPDENPLAAAGVAPPRPGVPWALLFWSGTFALVLLGIGVSAVDLVLGLFDRSGLLGAVGLVCAVVALIAAGVITVRELAGLLRLKAIDHMRGRAAEAILTDDRAAGRAAVTELLAITRRKPALAGPRARVQAYLGEIIDGRDLVHLAEREVIGPLDEEARRLVAGAATRVSVVTAVSPRAVVDLLFVLVTALTLVRQMARLYGGRPGTLGLVRLMRQVVSHLALTGGLSVGDGLMQQVLGQGLAAKLSARLGEGVLNGLLTARLGLAAIEVTRPLPFSAVKRPTLQDLAGGLVRLSDRSEPAAPVHASAAE